MSDQYRVTWSRMAEDDLLEIMQYIASGNKSNAKKIFRKIKDKASDLHFCPEKGRIVPELREYGIIQYRTIIIAPWRIMYRISGNLIYVMSVLDARRNIEDILLNRIIRE